MYLFILFYFILFFILFYFIFCQLLKLRPNSHEFLTNENSKWKEKRGMAITKMVKGAYALGGGGVGAGGMPPRKFLIKWTTSGAF